MKTATGKPKKSRRQLSHRPVAPTLKRTVRAAGPQTAYTRHSDSL